MRKLAVFHVVFRNVTTWHKKINTIFVGLLFILAIGFSRLYLGVHFWSDVDKKQCLMLNFFPIL
ncbi:TPA: hypothetical protein DGH83_02660 [Candidatus Peregrinibacteria bacterium]|nr:hypothetical protein [Candidatus Peregrinibacteria bacterium]